MNNKVAYNLEKLREISATSQNKQAILDALHPWRVSPNLRYHNTWSFLLLAACIVNVVLTTLYFSHYPLIVTVVWIGAIFIACFAYFSIEKQSEVDTEIAKLETQVFQYQYQVNFARFPSFNTQAGMNPNYMLARVRQGFACLNQGNAGNEIVDFASTTWQVQGHDFPVLLFQYVATTEVAMTNGKGEQITKQIEKHYWGACVFDMPALAFYVSNEKQKHARYPVEWRSSDAQFNRDFQLYGQQEFELAKNLTPSRILTLAHQLENMRGTLMFHDEMQAFCYISSQNIFQTRSCAKTIQNISQLRGHLRTLKAPHYERMQANLAAVIASFMDESVFLSAEQIMQFDGSNHHLPDVG